jgi:hypothetical protein
VAEATRGLQTTGAVVAFLAAILIALGTTSSGWWSGEKGALEMGVGLDEFELCAGTTCRTRGLEGLGGASQAWPRLGAIAVPTGWLASLFLIASAVAVMTMRRSRWTVSLGRAAGVAAFLALVVGAAFAWTYPGFDGLSAGWALAAYLAGGILGTGSAGVLIGGGGARPAP